MAAASKVSLKLLIDKTGNRVLFAEAGKEFVDFLFNLMSMPVGTVTRLLTENTSMSMVGSLGNLYHSIETLSETYLQTNQTREFLLKPKMLSPALNAPALLPNYCQNKASSMAVAEKKVYRCCKAAARKSIPCRKSTPYMVPPPEDQPVTTPSSSGDDGFVKGVVTYMVMDDLVVSPMSTITSIAILNKYVIKGINALEERLVELGMDEGLKLLKESFQSKAVLTNVFLKS